MQPISFACLGPICDSPLIDAGGVPSCKGVGSYGKGLEKGVGGVEANSRNVCESYSDPQDPLPEEMGAGVMSTVTVCYC